MEFQRFIEIDIVCIVFQNEHFLQQLPCNLQIVFYKYKRPKQPILNMKHKDHPRHKQKGPGLKNSKR